jgi:hypothetical protein
VFSAAIIILAWMGKIEPPRKIGRLDVLIKFIGATIAYLIGMQLVGYYLTTGIFLIAVIYRPGIPTLCHIGIGHGGWLLFAYIVFQRTLYVPFPVGKLWRMIAD